MTQVSQETMMFKRNNENKDVSQTISEVCKALEEKGYNPIDQLVGYLLSGDPTYITSHRNARSLIMKVERDELVEELLPGDAVKVTIEELEDGSRVIRL